jgi:ribonuclease P protein component
VVDQRFPKSCRLLDSLSFERVFKNPAFRVSNKYFLILGCWTHNDAARLGVIVAKKNISRATQRNRIKRQLREAFRTRNETPGIADFNADIVVMARKGLQLMKNGDCRANFHELLAEIAKKKPSI